MISKQKFSFLGITFFLTLATACGNKGTVSIPSNAIQEDQTHQPLNPAPDLPSYLTQAGKINQFVNNSKYDQCLSVVIDKEKNIYCAGVTDGSMGEENGGSADAFVMKTAPNGTVLWISQLGKSRLTEGQSSGYDSCLSIALDSNDNIFCAGYTEGSLGEKNAGGSDIFIAKLTSGGNILWITQLGKSTKGFAGGDNSKNDICHGVAVDGEGSVYCAGSTQGAIGEKNAGRNDAFILKLSPEGKVLWAKQLGEKTKGFPGANNKLSDECKSITIDLSNNVYCAGYTYGSLAETNAGEADAMIMKLSSNGAIYWIRQLGLTTKSFSKADHTKIDSCTSVTVDLDKNVYCAGYTYGAIGAINAGQSDGFVAKFNFSGSLQWAVQLTTNIYGTASSGEDRFSGVSVNELGDLFVSGNTTGDLGSKNAGFWNEDAFIAKISNSKNISWVKQIGQEISIEPANKSESDFCHAVALDEDFVSCAGSSFGSLGEENAGETDAFIWKMNL